MPEGALINNLQKENEFIVPETNTPTTIGVLYRSSNNGKTWSPFSNGIPEDATVSGFSAKAGQFIYAMTLGEGLLKTNNDGLNWQDANTGFGPVNLYTFEVKNRDRDLFAAQWQGIYHSANQGRYWAKINTGTNGLPDSTAFTTLEVTGFGILAGTGLK